MALQLFLKASVDSADVEFSIGFMRRPVSPEFELDVKPVSG